MEHECPYCKKNKPEPLFENSFIRIKLDKDEKSIWMCIETKGNPIERSRIQNCPKCGLGPY